MWLKLLPLLILLAGLLATPGLMLLRVPADKVAEATVTIVVTTIAQTLFCWLIAAVIVSLRNLWWDSRAWLALSGLFSLSLVLCVFYGWNAGIVEVLATIGLFSAWYRPHDASESGEDDDQSARP